MKRGAADLTLLDIEMPGMNGIQTLEQIRGDASLCGSRVIALTASDDGEMHRRMEELGAAGFLSILKTNSLRFAVPVIMLVLLVITIRYLVTGGEEGFSVLWIR